MKRRSQNCTNQVGDGKSVDDKSKYFNFKIFVAYSFYTGFPCSSVGKESACSTGDVGSIPGLGRSPGEGNGNLLPYPSLENLMDGGAWWDAVHEVAKSWIQLNAHTLTHTHNRDI